MTLHMPSSDITEQFKELQQLRKRVHKAELNFSRERRSPRDDVEPKADGRGSQNPSGRNRTSKYSVHPQGVSPRPA
jgi:hypothetical protein